MNASHQPTEPLGVVLPPNLCVNGSHAPLNLHHRQVCSLHLQHPSWVHCRCLQTVPHTRCPLVRPVGQDWLLRLPTHRISRSVLMFGFLVMFHGHQQTLEPVGLGILRRDEMIRWMGIHLNQLKRLSPFEPSCVKPQLVAFSPGQWSCLVLAACQVHCRKPRSQRRSMVNSLGWDSSNEWPSTCRTREIVYTINGLLVLSYRELAIIRFGYVGFLNDLLFFLILLGVERSLWR